RSGKVGPEDTGRSVGGAGFGETGERGGGAERDRQRARQALPGSRPQSVRQLRGDDHGRPGRVQRGRQAFCHHNSEDDGQRHRDGHGVPQQPASSYRTSVHLEASQEGDRPCSIH
ncbi:unnamed protein product, partial [Ectocarpus sp. 4 AP-2014]